MKIWHRRWSHINKRLNNYNSKKPPHKTTYKECERNTIKADNKYSPHYKIKKYLLTFYNQILKFCLKHKST